MTEILCTDAYREWVMGLRDASARIRVEARVRRFDTGNAGDTRSVGAGVEEMRIHHGPGYRIYFTRTPSEAVLLLAGGDKRNQRQDIRRAIRMKREQEAGDGQARDQ